MLSARSVYSKLSALIASALVLSLTLLYPYSGDNALFAYMTDLLLRGIPPYTGAWDHAFPGILLAHTIQLLAFGNSTIAMHVMDILIQLIAINSQFNLGRRVSGEVAGWTSALTYSLYYATHGSNTVVLNDAYVAVLLIAGLDLATSFPKPRVHAAAFVLGLTIIFRPTYGLAPLVYAGWLLIARKDAKRAVTSLVVAAIPSLLLLLALFAIGALEDFYLAVWTYNVEVYNRYTGFANYFDPFLRYGILLLPALLGASLIVQRTATSTLIALFLAVALVSLWLLFHAPYQYAPAFALLSIYCGAGWQLLMRLSVMRGLLNAIPALSMLLLLVLYLRGTTLKQSLFTFIETQDLLTAQAHFEPSPLWGISAQEQVADFLQMRTTRQDRVQGLSPLYPMLMAGVLPSSRFLIPHAFSIRAEDGSLRPYQVEWRKEYIRDLRSRPPLYYLVADSSKDASTFLNGHMPHAFMQQDFVELGALIKQDFSLDTVIGSFYIYRHRSRPRT